MYFTTVRRMTASGLLAALLVLLASVAAADLLHGPDIDALTETLELDAYQAGEVRRVLEAQRDRVRAAVAEHRKKEQESGSDDHTELMQKIQEARSQTRQKLALVLSAEQLAKYDGFVKGPQHHH